MMETLLEHFFDIFTIEGAIALRTIMIIDLVMSGDNRIVIGMATKDLPIHERHRAIEIGIIIAAVMRIVFSIVAVYLLLIPGLQFVGGLLLLYISYNFYRDLRNPHEEQIDSLAKDVSLKTAITTIIIADVSMSLDNVLGVAGASKGNLVILGIGLVFSILFMALAANAIAKVIHKYPLIAWFGLIVIIYVGISMIYEDLDDITRLYNYIISYIS